MSCHSNLEYFAIFGHFCGSFFHKDSSIKVVKWPNLIVCTLCSSNGTCVQSHVI